MKLEKPINGNYCATVFKVKKIVELQGCDMELYVTLNID